MRPSPFTQIARNASPQLRAAGGERLQLQSRALLPALSIESQRRSPKRAPLYRISAARQGFNAPVPLYASVVPLNLHLVAPAVEIQP